MLLLSGNEAIARGAYEIGVLFSAGYPGTPSTEILETIAEHYKNAIYCEWSPNEKVAFEVAVGASFSGARAITTMKHVGLNVASDPLMVLSYIGVIGGFVAVVADDPGMHSSQNEQDTRHFARFAKVPILEPSDSQEAKDFLKNGILLSEHYHVPVLLRTTTRVAHSRGLVDIEDRVVSDKPIVFRKQPSSFRPLSVCGREIRQRVEERVNTIVQECNDWFNQIIWKEKKIGIITSGVAYQYVCEVFPEVSVLKIGMSFPFPDKLIRDFATQIEKVIVIEELDDFLEEHVKSLGIDCHGKNLIPKTGELSPDILHEVRCQLFSTPTKSVSSSQIDIPALPHRPPMLCPGCPHRGLFYALNKIHAVVTGDIGCYALGMLPPLSALDVILCMGGGVTLAHGIDKVQQFSFLQNTSSTTAPQKVVGIVGDSTFFHSGITGLLDIAYNKGQSTIIVLDNRITAMTGHQENPGSGKTLNGETTGAVSIEEIGKACGIKNVRTVNPYNVRDTISVLKEATEASAPYLIVSKASCPLHVKNTMGPPLSISEIHCKKCNTCLGIGCPAIEKTDTGLHINPLLCVGCALCKNICPVDAIG